MDYTYIGNGIGLYSSSSVISLQNSVVKVLPDPEEEYASQEEAQKLGVVAEPAIQIKPATHK